MKDSVRELLIQARDGSEEAFTQIFILYQNSVYSKALSIMQNDANAQDIVQETFLIVHKNLHQLRDLNLFYSWLMRITISRCQMYFRKHKHDANQDYEDQIINQREERSYFDPEMNMRQVNEREILLSMIDTLSPKKAEVIKLAYLKEMRMDEIAEALGVNVNTVKTRAKRGKEELQNMITAYEQKEGISLHFRADVILPATFFITAIHPSFLQIVLQKLTKSTQLIKQNMVMSSCCASLSVLAVSGSVFVYQDYQEQTVKETVPHIQSTAPETSTNQQEKPSQPPVMKESNVIQFQSVTYGEEQIKTVREAYYSCLIFGKTEDDFNRYSDQELHAFQPVYTALQKSNSPYYQQLIDMGWVELYERYLTQ